jgi:hypothetical protein
MERSDLWTPESPFLESAYQAESKAEPGMEIIGEVIAPWAQAESPFVRDEVIGAQGESESAEVISELLTDLEDEDFTATVYEMTAEAQDVAARGNLNVYSSQETAQIETQRLLEQHFSGLIAEAERAHTAIGEGLSRYDLTHTSEAELESLIAQFVPAPAISLTPVQEQFLGGLVRTVGRAVKGAVNFVKKGVKAVGKGLSAFGRTVLMPLLRKLGNLVKPLLQRVIQFAMGKLPASVRPIAQKLADKLFGKQNEFEAEAVSGSFASAPSAHNIQMEYNFLIAEAVLATGNGEMENEQFAGPMVLSEGSDYAGKLHEATRQLAEQLAELKEGEDPRPAIQQFLPAALLALQPIIKGVIAIIGRDKVVNFIAGLIAKLISRWIGEDQAKMLATPVVDVGLRLIGFEQPEQGLHPRLAAAEVLAQTVQETVLNLVQQPPSAFEQPNLVQALTMEAFEAAVQSNFPSDALRPELRETSEGSGQWRLMPAGGRRHWYKKYTQVFEVSLEPAALKRIKTFADVPLADALAATTTAVTSRTVKARVHVYELLIGSRLVDIARLERKVGGLGSYHWTSWRRLMPLTPEAASMLLPSSASGLGRNPGPQFLQGAYLTAPGQRFYHIELPGDAVAPAQPKTQGGGGSGSGTGGVGGFNDVGIIFNLIRGVITVKIRLSETTAQEMATYLRRKDAATPVQIMRRAFGGLEALRQGQLKVGFRVEGEASNLQEYLEAAQQNENFLPAAAAGVAAKIGQELLSKLAAKLFDALWNAVARYLDNKGAEFISATENPAQGVTILIAFAGITSLQRYRDIRDGRLASGISGFLTDRLKGLAMPITALPIPSIAIRAGMM